MREIFRGRFFLYDVIRVSVSHIKGAPHATLPKVRCSNFDPNRRPVSQKMQVSGADLHMGYALSLVKILFSFFKKILRTKYGFLESQTVLP